MRDIIFLSMKEGVTPLSGEEFTKRFLKIDGRLHDLEELSVSWEAAVALLNNTGLARINEVLHPLVSEAQGRIQAIQDELTAIQTDWAAIQAAWDAVAGTIDAINAAVATNAAGISDVDSRIGRGPASARPALGAPSLYLNTDDNVTELLDGAGAVIAVLGPPAYHQPILVQQFFS